MTGNEWVTFTRRTNDPKLKHIERELDKIGVEHRREGQSYHAPITKIRQRDMAKAWGVLEKEYIMPNGTVKPLDDIDDNNALFWYKPIILDI